MPKRSNPWPFSKPKPKASVPRRKGRSGITFAAAMREAKEQGYKGKDFNEWLERKRLDERGSAVVSRLGQAYRDGIDKRDADDKRKADAREAQREAVAARRSKVADKRAAQQEKTKEDRKLMAIDEAALKRHYAKGGTFAEFQRGDIRNPSKRKQNPADVSAEVFEEFHGYPASEIVKVKRDRHHHEHLAAAGELVGLQVKPVGHGPVRKIEGLGKNCFLAFNEAKNQLFIEGGNQGLTWDELKAFGIRTEHELQTIGKLVAVGYFTDKVHLGEDGGEAIYSHVFRTTNENGKHIVVTIARYPDLIYRVLDEQFEVSGGDYKIRREGIDV